MTWPRPMPPPPTLPIMFIPGGAPGSTGLYGMRISVLVPRLTRAICEVVSVPEKFKDEAESLERFR